MRAPFKTTPREQASLWHQALQSLQTVVPENFFDALIAGLFLPPVASLEEFESALRSVEVEMVVCHV